MMRASLLGCSLILLLVPGAEAATIVVNSNPAHGPVCTIIDAINAANLDTAIAGCAAGSGADVIQLEPIEYLIDTPYVPDDGYHPWSAVAFPDIASPITIQGAGRDVTVIRRDPNAPAFRFFYVSWLTGFELRDLTLSGGYVPDSYAGGAVLSQDRPITARRVRFENNRSLSGGALADTNYFGTEGSDFLIENCAFVGNDALAGGGALKVSSGGTLVVRQSQFTDNHGEYGGAIMVNGGVASAEITNSEFFRNTARQTGGAINAADLSITHSLFQRNYARDGGGALYSYGGTPHIVNSTFSGNWSREGGAIKVHGGSIEISDSTLSGNDATDFAGGGLYLDNRAAPGRITNSTFSGNRSGTRGSAITMHEGELTLINTTVAFNTNMPGGWSYGIALGFFGTTTLRLSNSIVVGNTVDGVAIDIAASANEHVVSLGHNIIGAGENTNGAFSADGDHVGTADAPVDAGLLPLDGNGGSTLTHALAAGSIALDSGSPLPPGVDEACLPVDQRGIARPGAGTPRCDIGAYEREITYQVMLTVGPGGSVAGLDTALPCHGTCVARFGSGAEVSLVANPADGYQFDAWTGACTGKNPSCVVTVGGDKSVGATFSLLPPPNSAPHILSPANQHSNDRDPVVLALLAIDDDGDTLVFDADGLPPGLSIDPSTGTITGTIWAAGDFDVTVRVSDGHGGEDQASFSWHVLHVIPPPAMLNIREFVYVDDAVVLRPSAMLRIFEDVVVDDVVGLLRRNTSTGSNVNVGPAPGVSLTFSGVTSPGQTTAQPSSVPPPPAGFELTVPSVAFEITTTAGYTGPITVCFAYPANSVAPRLMHYEAGRWVDRTTSTNTSTHTVCGSVTHLSPFAVFVPVALEGRMKGHGALDQGNDQEFDFQFKEREIGAERGKVDFAVTTPKVGKQKARTDRFRSTVIGAMTFADDPGFRPGARKRPDVDSVAVIGQGTWNGVPGYTFEVFATDRGEPGRGRDSFAITVRDESGAVVISLSNVIAEGNIQSQRLPGR